jgi:hypothetical protein
MLLDQLDLAWWGEGTGVCHPTHLSQVQKGMMKSSCTDGSNLAHVQAEQHKMSSWDMSQGSNTDGALLGLCCCQKKIYGENGKMLTWIFFPFFKSWSHHWPPWRLSLFSGHPSYIPSVS